MSSPATTPCWGPDFDALAAVDADIAGVVVDELDRLRGGLQPIDLAAYGAGVRELVGARPATPGPAAFHPAQPAP